MTRHDDYVHRRTSVGSMLTGTHDTGTSHGTGRTWRHDDGGDVRPRFRSTRLCDEIRGTAHSDVIIVYGARVLEKNVQTLEEHWQNTQSNWCAASFDPTAR